jgi:RHS repeat-associated protein
LGFEELEPLASVDTHERRACARRIDANGDGDYVDGGDGTWYHLTDAQFSTVCLVDDEGAVAERVSYSAYGIARHHWKGDVDGDGAVTVSGGSSDLGLVAAASGSSIGGSGYRSEYDLDRDGDVDAADQALVGSAAAGLPSGQLSPVNPAGPDSQAGWDGYLYAAETGLYEVRFRAYSPELGRWMELDPSGYQRGLSLFAGLNSSPPNAVDPFGLKPTTIRYTTFIPQNYLQLLDKLYQGDGSPLDVSFNRDRFRTRQTVEIELDQVPCGLDPSALMKHTPETGVSKRYGKSWTGIQLPGEEWIRWGHQEWFLESTEQADPNDQVQAVISNVAYARSPCGECCVTKATINLTGEAYNPVGPLGTPAIDYNVTLMFSRFDCCSPGQWTFSNSHDGFPSHLLFVSGMGANPDGLVYWYDASSQDPMSLFGDGDVSVGPRTVNPYKEPKGCVHGLLY